MPGSTVTADVFLAMQVPALRERWFSADEDLAERSGGGDAGPQPLAAAPAVLAATCGGVLAGAALALISPALGAMRIDPATALRAQ